MDTAPKSTPQPNNGFSTQTLFSMLKHGDDIEAFIAKSLGMAHELETDGVIHRVNDLFKS
jgi:hypothetical protein